MTWAPYTDRVYKLLTSRPWFSSECHETSVYTTHGVLTAGLRKCLWGSGNGGVWQCRSSQHYRVWVWVCVQCTHCGHNFEFWTAHRCKRQKLGVKNAILLTSEWLSCVQSCSFSTITVRKLGCCPFSTTVSAQHGAHVLIESFLCITINRNVTIYIILHFYLCYYLYLYFILFITPLDLAKG